MAVGLHPFASRIRTSVGPLFEGLSAEDVAQALARLQPRRFPAGCTVIAEGDSLYELYVVRSGTADVFITDRGGDEHLVNRVGPGATLGEMSLFTGQPASATVRATTDLDVLVLGEGDFHDTLARFPRMYHNLGAILSRRLALSERRSLGGGPGDLTVLLDDGAPPLLGYALACSIAWHANSPTLLLIAGDSELPPELDAFVAATFGARSSLSSSGLAMSAVPTGVGPRAHLGIVRPDGVAGASTAGALTRMVEAVRGAYAHVLVQVRGESPPLIPSHRVRLADSCHPPVGGGDFLPGYTVEAWSETAESHGPDVEGRLHVPPLEQPDWEALRTGTLQNSTPTGRALGWLARDLVGLKIGVALGAGSVKGYAHIGVLRALARIGLPLDYLSGTSVGAAVAFLHAAGHSADEAAGILDTVAASLFRLTLPIRSLLSSASLRRTLQSVGKGSRIEELPLPLAVGATDILTGREVVFRRGPAWRAVLASISIPGVYPPVRIGPHLLVDGGVLNPVPSNIAAEMGADTVIAVRLGSRFDVSGAESARVPSVLQTIIRSIEIMQSKIAAEAAGAATILIEPEFGKAGGMGLRDFRQGRRYIELGEAAAEAALPRLVAAFPWLRM